MPYNPRDTRPRAVHVAVTREEFDELNEDVGALFDQLTVLTRAVAGLIPDVEGLVDYLSPPEDDEVDEAEGPHAYGEGGPDDLHYGTGDPGEDAMQRARQSLVEQDLTDETPEEEAARLRREAAEQFVRENEEEVGPVDFNDITDVPAEGRDV